MKTIDFPYKIDTVRLGMWIFIAMETIFFSGAIFLYSGSRHFHSEAFSIASAHLELGLAAANTVVLLTSSLTMALAVYFLENGRRRKAATLLAATTLLGLGFLGIKGYEYSLDIAHGTLVVFNYRPDFPAPQGAKLFFSLYLLLTSLHALHLTIGVLWCATVAMIISRGKTGLTDWQPRVDVLGLYWHFIDIVWIFLLPLFYLVERPY